MPEELKAWATGAEPEVASRHVAPDDPTPPPRPARSAPRGACVCPTCGTTTTAAVCAVDGTQLT